MYNETTNEETTENKYDADYVDVYKKWRAAGTEGGFINFQYWPEHHKVIVDIGSTKNGNLTDNAKCYVNANQFMAYLKAEVDNNLTHIFPDFFATDAKAGWASYGGGHTDGKVIARVFKVTQWVNDPKSRDFKCGWFEGRLMAQGAIAPQMDKQLKREHIKMSMFEIAELYQAMSLAIANAQPKLKAA